jgi:hypothetical protein
VAEQITEAAKSRVLELMRSEPEGVLWSAVAEHALARFIMQVSDAAKEIVAAGGYCQTKDGRFFEDVLAPFILPDPVDPHEQAIIEVISRWSEDDGYFATDAIRDAFKRGIELAHSNG